MTIGETWLPEFDLEMANTRKTLARIPDDRLDWKAHPRSNTIGWLARHLADIPGWAVPTMNADELDFAPVGAAATPRPEPAKTIAEILQTFDANVAAAREAIAGAKDEAWGQPWSLKSGGYTIFTQPRAGVLRGFVFSHMVHHRAILTVYLRLNEIPVPALYGPSGDENPFG